MEQTFVPATKTSHGYQGKINGKTYVVPHSRLDIYNPKGYATPLRHAIVTSLSHVKNNNPNLTPEELTRVHEHIKNLHGGQEPAKLEEMKAPIRGDVFHHHQTLVAKKTLRMPDAMVNVLGGQTKEEAREHLKKMGWTKKQIHDHEHAVNEEYDYPDPGPSHPHQVGDTVNYFHGTRGHIRQGKIIAHDPTHVTIRPVNSPYSYKIAHKDVLKEDTMLNEAKLFPHLDDSADSHKMRMVHALTTYDRKQADAHKKNPRRYHNPYAIGHYLHAADAAHEEMKKGTSPAEAVNNNFVGHLADHLHKQLGTGDTSTDTKRRALFKEHSGSEKRLNPDGSYKAGLKVTVDGKPGEISHVHHSQEHPKYPHSYKVTDLSANDPYKQTRLRGNTFISHHDIKPVNEAVEPAKEGESEIERAWREKRERDLDKLRAKTFKIDWVHRDPYTGRRKPRLEESSEQLQEHGYVGFDHKGNRHEVEAPTSYAAHQMIIAKAKTPKSQQHKVHASLAELDTPEGRKQYYHTASESVEQLNELKKSTLKSYIGKAAKDIRQQERGLHRDMEAANRTKSLLRAKRYDRNIDTAIHKGDKRIEGIARATEKLEESLQPPTKAFMNAPENKAMYAHLKTKKREEKKAAKSERPGLTDRFLRRFGEEHTPEDVLAEKVLTSAETAKKEEIVHSLKPKLQSFKSRYGAEKGKSVMYAVATKQAKKLAEQVYPTGTKVSVPHKGQMVVGKVVRYDKGEKHGSPFYVVDHGAYESAKVPAHKVKLHMASHRSNVGDGPYLPSLEEAKDKKSEYTTKGKFDYKKFSKDRQKNPHKFIAGLGEGVNIDRNAYHKDAPLSKPAVPTTQKKDGDSKWLEKLFPHSPKNKHGFLPEARLAMPLKGHPYHHKTDAELHYIIKDAGEAEKAVGTHNVTATHKYADQQNDAATVLGYRQRGGKQLSESKKEENPFRYHMDKVNHYLTMKNPDKTKAKFHFGQAIKHHAEGDKILKSLKESEEVEQLDEISLGLAHKVHDARIERGDEAQRQAVRGPYHNQAQRKANKEYEKADKTGEYIGRKNKALAFGKERLMKETLDQLDEDLNMGPGVHKVIKAFLNKQPLEGKKLSTDGKRLDGNWLGGRGIAHHEGGKVHLNDLGSRSGQQVHRAIKKHLTYGSGSNVPHYETELHESHSSTYKTVKNVLNEMMTRKHFQQVADVIKAHPDAKKRKELAQHHAGIFKASNPRFDQKKFYAAAGVSGD